MTEPYRPTLHRLPDDTRGRFQILREFLRRWHGIDTGAAGRTVARIARAEKAVKHRLPLAVREWIVLLDDLDRLGAWGHVLRDCWSLVRVPDCPAFSLLVQGEDDHHWGPMLRDLDREDPPTHSFLIDYDRSPSRFVRDRQVAPRVSTWAVEFILTYLRLSRCAQVDHPVPDAVADRLFKRPPPGHVASRVGKTRLLEYDGGLIHIDSDDETLLRCYAPFATLDEHREVEARLHTLLDTLTDT